MSEPSPVTAPLANHFDAPRVSLPIYRKDLTVS